MCLAVAFLLVKKRRRVTFANGSASTLAHASLGAFIRKLQGYALPRFNNTMSLRRLLCGASLAAAMRTLSVKTVSPPHALSRRGLLDTAAASAATIALPALAEVEQLAAPGKSVGAMQKLKSGVRYIDLKEGSGAGASSGSRVSLQWVLRRSNGYFVTSSFGQVASGPDAGILKLSGMSSPNDPFLFTVGSCVEIKFTARSR